MIPIIILILSLLCFYFAFRYYSLLKALKKVTQDLEHLNENIKDNGILRLPLPNHGLGHLLTAINRLLQKIQAERIIFQKREDTFQKEMENISHDMRTPLTVILGYLKWFKIQNGQGTSPYGQDGSPYENGQNGIDQEAFYQALKVMEYKAQSMQELINQFYDFSRIEAGHFQLHLEAIDVTRLLRESLMSHYKLLEEAELIVDVTLPDKAIMVMGDELALDRVFVNLFQNASRYGQRFLKLEMLETDSLVTIRWINDTAIIEGESLSQESLNLWFERFYRQDASRHTEGTGLGLPLAKELLEKMKGTLVIKKIQDEPLNENERHLNHVAPVICLEVTLLKV